LILAKIATMHFQSTILLLLVAFAAKVSTAVAKGRPPPQFPTFSAPHKETDNYFTYCEQFAPHAKKLPRAKYNHFDALCKSIPDTLTLSIYNASTTEHCQSFINGTATVEYCNFDLCKKIYLYHLQDECRKLVSSCFGSKNIPFEYTRASTRFRNPKWYWALSVNGSTPAIEALEPVCNGIPLGNGTMLATLN
jgi:hypothetical protein